MTRALLRVTEGERCGYVTESSRRWVYMNRSRRRQVTEASTYPYGKTAVSRTPVKYLGEEIQVETERMESLGTKRICQHPTAVPWQVEREALQPRGSMEPSRHHQENGVHHSYS